MHKQTFHKITYFNHYNFSTVFGLIFSQYLEGSRSYFWYRFFSCTVYSVQFSCSRSSSSKPEKRHGDRKRDVHEVKAREFPGEKRKKEKVRRKTSFLYIYIEKMSSAHYFIFLCINIMFHAVQSSGYYIFFKSSLLKHPS